MAGYYRFMFFYVSRLVDGLSPVGVFVTYQSFCLVTITNIIIIIIIVVVLFKCCYTMYVML